MAHHEEMPYIVIERHSPGLGAFLWGALIGAGAALLLAPRSGRETREEIAASAQRLRDRAEDMVRGVADTVDGTIRDVRGEVHGRIDAAREAFEAGRQAARETRREMESRVREVRAGVRGGMDAARRDDGASHATGPAGHGSAGDDDELGV